jgi:hypothetical protein
LGLNRITVDRKRLRVQAERPSGVGSESERAGEVPIEPQRGTGDDPGPTLDMVFSEQAARGALLATPPDFETRRERPIARSGKAKTRPGEQSP